MTERAGKKRDSPEVYSCIASLAGFGDAAVLEGPGNGPCLAPDNSFATCECPDDFECIEILDLGGPGVRGSYCVKKDTVAAQ